MGFEAGDTLRSLLSVKIKARHDSYSDQVSRIIVTKIFILASVVMSIDWFQGETNCIPPKDNKLPEAFIHQACWVRGFYVYTHLSDYMRISSYYGVPNELKYDGYFVSDPSHLCEINPSGAREIQSKNKNTCVPMVKEYYTQYQWMPFCVSFIGFLFYFPYMVFRVANTDIISLKWNLRNVQVTAEQIVHSYFNHTINSQRRNRIRIVANYIVKLLYLINGILAFVFLNWLLNYRFNSYGTEWLRWAKGNSTEKFDFKTRTHPTPGNLLLPTFALCDLHDVRVDLTNSYGNSVIVVCEMSSHILYQYAFIVFWFVLIFAVISSVLGLLVYIGNHLYLVYSTKAKSEVKIFYKYMTIREFEYLEFVRQRDLAMYGKILKMLNESVIDQSTIPLTFQPQCSEIDKGGGVTNKRPLLRHLDSILGSE